VAGAAEPLAASGELTAHKRPFEHVDDDVASVLVELDDSAVLKPMIVETKDVPSKATPSKNIVRRSTSYMTVQNGSG
jgi:hypothetical protein